MKIFVVGASGLIGSHLVPLLLREGHSVVATSRHPEKDEFPAGVQVIEWDTVSPLSVPSQAAAPDAIVNLAGERVIGKRWTKTQMQRIRDSRIESTRRIAEYIARLPKENRPALVCASAAGYYGPNPAGPCPESRPPGDDFLAKLCIAWEAAAREAPTRVVNLRFGHVLAREGGYLGKLLPFAKMGAAGPIAGGRQPMPWVHIADVAGAILWACTNPAASGAYNVASPGATGTNQRDFAKALGVALNRPIQLPVPGIALKLRYGSAVGPALLGGQDMPPERLTTEGFRFRFANLDEALLDLLSA